MDKAKSRIVYAVVGLILVILACPLVSYVVENTDIAPFDESASVRVCRYLMLLLQSSM